jgi:hypothetical protein
VLYNWHICCHLRNPLESVEPAGLEEARLLDTARRLAEQSRDRLWCLLRNRFHGIRQIYEVTMEDVIERYSRTSLTEEALCSMSDCQSVCASIVSGKKAEYLTVTSSKSGNS